MKSKILPLLVFIILLKIVEFSHAIKLHCEYKNVNDLGNVYYICIVNNFTTTFEDRNVTEVIGEHVVGKRNEDVTTLKILLEDCPFLPLGIQKNFPKFKILIIINSNVQHLLTGDLDEYKKLEELDLSNNPIEQIGRDFFRGKGTIERIKFQNCNLKKIDPKAFDPLINLKFAYFSSNESIDNNYGYSEIQSIRFLKNRVTSNCQGDHHELKSYFKKNCKKNVEASENFFIVTFIIITLVSLTVVMIIFILLFINIYKEIFQGNWTQIRRHLIN